MVYDWKNILASSERVGYMVMPNLEVIEFIKVLGHELSLNYFLKILKVLDGGIGNAGYLGTDLGTGVTF